MKRYTFRVNLMSRSGRPLVTCRICNGFAGHFDGDHFIDCRGCNGAGEV